MSARTILTLALIALVALPANSSPYATQGGQFEQESLQAHLQGQQTTSSQELVSNPGTQQTQTTTTAVAQTELAPAQQQFYGAPSQATQQVVAASAPVETTFGTTSAVPTTSAVYPSKGQALYQPPARVYGSKGGQAFYQQEQRLEAAPLKQPASQSLATEQVGFTAPSKGQLFYQQPAQVYSSKVGQPFYQQERLPAQQFESAPFKGVQTQHTKSQWVAPARHESSVAQQPLPVASAPVKTQVFDYQPAKGYQHRLRQPLRAPFKGSQAQQYQYMTRPAFGQVSSKA